MSVKQINSLLGLVALLAGLGFTSCEVINPEEDIPSYIHIDSISLNSSYSSPHNITDAWVYVNDDLKGMVELPATFPIVAGGPVNLKILPGVKMNGIALTRIIYPFFEIYDTDIELIRDSIIYIKPETSYKGTTVWNEDFEDISFSLQATGKSDTTMNRVTTLSDVFQGTGCGSFVLTNAQSAFEAISSATFKLPKGGTPVFLEVHYRCNNTFAVGIFSNTTTQVVQVTPSLVVNPKSEWNRIYINLTNEVSAQNNAFDYNIYFYMEKDPGNTIAEVFIDNIRLVHQ